MTAALLTPARMWPRDVLKVGAVGLRTRPLRAFLSSLGIAIGIAAMVSVVGLLVLAGSVVLAPEAWREFLGIVVAQAPTSGASIVPIPFPVRALIGLGLAIAGGHLAWRGRRRLGEGLLILGLIVANPTLWVTAMSIAIALVPLWRSAPPVSAPNPARLREAIST